MALLGKKCMLQLCAELIRNSRADYKTNLTNTQGNHVSIRNKKSLVMNGFLYGLNVVGFGAAYAQVTLRSSFLELFLHPATVF